MGRLGIIAGGGSLPRRIADVSRSSGRDVFIVAFEGQTDAETIEGLDHEWFKLGAMAAPLKRMASHGVDEVVMAGPMRRPAWSEMSIDFRGTKMLARGGRRAFGDDGLLSLIVEELEHDGFRVLGIDDVLGDFIVPAGIIAGEIPDETAQEDITRGVEVLQRIGAADVGQAVAVQQGLVLAVEAVEGTDQMISRAGALKREGLGPILIKLRKPGQERRADLPTIGPDTVECAANAGFRGIAVEGGGSLIVDREALCEVANNRDLFVVAIEI